MGNGPEDTQPEHRGLSPSSRASASAWEEAGVRGLQRILEAETLEVRLPAAGGDLCPLMSVPGPP